jgi:hypothetical protein
LGRIGRLGSESFRGWFVPAREGWTPALHPTFGTAP